MNAYKIEQLEKNAEADVASLNKVIDINVKRIEKGAKEVLGWGPEEMAIFDSAVNNLPKAQMSQSDESVKDQPTEEEHTTAKAAPPENNEPIDNPEKKPHNKDMSDIPTHIYIDKSIASLEKTMSDNLLRMETIVANSLEANKAANDNLKTRLDESIGRFEATANEIKDEYKQTRGYFSNLKLQSIAIAAAAVVGLAGLNYALVQNVTGSFALGQSSADVVKNEVANQISPLVAKISQSDAKIDKMNDTLNRLISAPAATPNFSPSSPQSPAPEQLRLFK